MAITDGHCIHNLFNIGLTFVKDILHPLCHFAEKSTIIAASLADNHRDAIETCLMARASLAILGGLRLLHRQLREHRGGQYHAAVHAELRALACL